MCRIFFFGMILKLWDFFSRMGAWFLALHDCLNVVFLCKILFISLVKDLLEFLFGICPTLSLSKIQWSIPYACSFQKQGGEGRGGKHLQ